MAALLIVARTALVSEATDSHGWWQVARDAVDTEWVEALRAGSGSPGG